jgi:hypothetical protein
LNHFLTEPQMLEQFARAMKECVACGGVIEARPYSGFRQTGYDCALDVERQREPEAFYTYTALPAARELAKSMGPTVVFGVLDSRRAGLHTYRDEEIFIRLAVASDLQHGQIGRFDVLFKEAA